MTRRAALDVAVVFAAIVGLFVVMDWLARGIG